MLRGLPAGRCPRLLLLVALAQALLLSPELRADGVGEEKRAGKVLSVGERAPRFALKVLNPERSGCQFFSSKRILGSGASEPCAALVLSFGASYCLPCRKELPALKALEARFRERGVRVAEVVLDREPEGIEAMRKLVTEELDLPFPVLSDRFTILARRYGADELPFLVLIDRGGTIRWLHRGFTEDAITRLQAELKALLAEAPPEAKQLGGSGESELQEPTGSTSSTSPRSDKGTGRSKASPAQP